MVSRSWFGPVVFRVAYVEICVAGGDRNHNDKQLRNDHELFFHELSSDCLSTINSLNVRLASGRVRFMRRSEI